MKICLIMAGKGIGGLEKHTIELSNRLASQNIDISVICHESFKELFNKNVNFIPLDLTKGRNNIFILYKLYNIIKENKFDIVHTQANKATEMLLKIYSFIDTKVIATLHNVKSNIKSYNKIDKVIVVSKRIGDKITNKKVVIYNGIQVDNEIKDIDLHQKYGISKDKLIICSVGRMSKVKRFDLLINAMSEIDNIHLILVGSGTEEKKLKKITIDNNLESDVTFTGMLSNNEAKEIMKGSDLFILPSDHEGFGYVFIESLMMNTPVISTDVADIKEIIGEQYIFPFNDSTALANKIDEIRNNFDEVKKDCEKRLFPLIKNQFTLENMSSETIKLYKDVLND